jgi:hypothetical protein
VVGLRTQHTLSSGFRASRELGGLVLAATLIGAVMVAAAFYGARKTRKNTIINTIDSPRTGQYLQQQFRSLPGTIDPVPTDHLLPLRKQSRVK